MFKLGAPLSELTRIKVQNRFPQSDEAVLSKLGLWPETALKPNSKVFTIGSCFARNVEEVLRDSGFTVPMLDFAVPEEEWPAPARRNSILNRYTPQNVYQTVRWAYDCLYDFSNLVDNTRRFMIASDEKVIDADLSGFVPVLEERFWTRRAEMLETFNHILTSDYIIITFGQTEAWFYEPTGVFWSRLPANRDLRTHYDTTRYSVVDVHDAEILMSRTIELIRTMNPYAQIILSVSPVAADVYWQDGNGLISYWNTKTTLLHAAKNMVWDFKNVFYFPSFEAVHMLDNAWEPDRMHVRPEVVSEIVRRLL